MKRSSIKRTIVLLTAVSTGLLGCELIVDFDRTLIPPEEAGAPEAGSETPDVVTPDAGNDDAADAADAADDVTDAADDVADANDQ